MTLRKVYLFTLRSNSKSALNVQVSNFDVLTDINTVYSRFNTSNKICENTNTPSYE